MSYDEPPEPLEPEDDPEGYRDCLRRQVVALLRRYLIDHGEKGLDLNAPFGSWAAPLEVTMEDVAGAIRTLDEWKRDFNLKDID